MRIAIASDHGGFEMKEALKKHFSARGVTLNDLGTYSSESVDYPDYADKMADCILTHQADLGILICGTGIGISIAANRHKGIRAALIYNQYTAQMAKEHNNANVVVFGGRTMLLEDVIANLDVFLNENYQGGHHQQRLDKLDK